MVKVSNARINFNTKLLKKLRKRDNSGVKVHTEVQHLAIQPHQLHGFSDSVKGLLSAKVAKYNKTLNGILLGYQDIKLLQDGGIIHDDSCYIHFDIQADFYVFQPEIGKIMEGIVNRKSKDHIGALVYEAFNVSIPVNSEEGEERLGDSVKIGDKVTFEITFINLASFLPYIRGKLIAEPEVFDSLTEEVKVKKKKKKSKVKDDRTEELEEEV